MSYRKALVYSKCIEPLAAEEMQRGLVVSAFPHLKKEKAKKVSKDIKKAARPQFKREAPKSTEELYNSLIRTLGNG